jgi:hypothetical protein
VGEKLKFQRTEIIKLCQDYSGPEGSSSLRMAPALSVPAEPSLQGRKARVGDPFRMPESNPSRGTRVGYHPQ